MSSSPISLYVHVPWCVKKCPYCDFNSHELTKLSAKEKQALEAQYLKALLLDLDAEIGLLEKSCELATMFIGGGTPSLMTPDFYARLLNEINARLPLAGDVEITMEANPGTVDAKYFSGYRQAGINRLSIGVQSFSDAALVRLGRIHSSGDATAAFEIARQSGFNNINLDIMHGLPGQNLEAALEDLSQAIALGPEHVSWYQLTIEKNTAFYNQPPPLPEENILDDIFTLGQRQLAAAGYEQYEISAYAQSGKASQHNLNYWQFGDYVGIGAGAHGKLSVGNTQRRRWKTRVPEHYFNSADKLSGDEPINQQELALEYLMNALRLINGFSITQFETKTALSIDVIRPGLDRQIEQGLLKESGEKIAATPLGIRYLDSILADF